MSFDTYMLFFEAAGVSEDMVDQVRPKVYEEVRKTKRRRCSNIKTMSHRVDNPVNAA